MQRTLLIVDDIDTNREILKKILGGKYSILEASNGQEALALMHANSGALSAVLLDLAMPVMNGFEALERIREDEALSHIPVIVTTGTTEEESEVRALTLGANDYITKPYNSTIIKQRIWNTINLRETAAAVNALQRDRLTGLLNREIFFEKASDAITSREAGYYSISAFDIDNFKVINDQYGTEKGDEVLRHVARCLKRWAGPRGGLCARMMADNFVVLYPAAYLSTESVVECRFEAMHPPCIPQTLSIRIGRYLVTDASLSVSAMYDRAKLAESTVRGRFDRSIAQYDESMRTHILREQEIVNEMNAALTGGQFEVWFQPQINHATGALIGAEGLVRWNHPKRGLVSPGEFIPAFERNGFIYELDKFVWEQTCSYLRKWMAAGLDPHPVSVNVSRYDLLCDDLIPVLTALTNAYGVPTRLLRLEVTESAFSQSADRIIDAVEALSAKGFTIEIDDFGSGYSSLNTLKDVPADILKLDMRFLESGRNSARGGNILESIVRMAKWLGMPVIAEGVETLEQADYLQSIGCYYLQGYLYARPMPASEYEAFFTRCAKEDGMRGLETLEELDNDAFWDPSSMETLIFNSYVGGACIFEYINGRMELLRINENYVRELGLGELSITDALELDVERYMDETNRALLAQNIRNAIDTNAESACEVRLSGLGGSERSIYIRTAVRVIAHTGERYLIYCAIFNMTALRESEHKERAAYERIAQLPKELLDNLPCGAALYRLSGGLLHAELLNKRYQELVGRVIDDPAAVSAVTPVHPDDQQGMLKEIRAGIAEKRDIGCRLRIRYGDTEDVYRPFWVSGRVIENADGSYCVYAAFDPVAETGA